MSAAEPDERVSGTSDAHPSDVAPEDAYAPAEPLEIATALRDDGVNVVGYLTRQTSLGDVARRLLSALDAAGVPVAPIATHRTASSHCSRCRRTSNTRSGSDTVAVVTADQFPLLARDRPELFAATRRMIGYWFWELEHVPRPMRDALGLVDEVWVGSRFVASGRVAAVTRKPVRHVPIPVPATAAVRRAARPTSALLDGCAEAVRLPRRLRPPQRDRAQEPGRCDRGVPAGVPDAATGRSGARREVDERLEPVARAPSASSPPPTGAADIRCVDEAHVARRTSWRSSRAVDCLVSLHRSEGLGLHLAEAMWLGTPTIATRYSGNLDFMDDDYVDARRRRRSSPSATRRRASTRRTPGGPSRTSTTPRPRWCRLAVGRRRCAHRSARSSASTDGAAADARDRSAARSPSCWASRAGMRRYGEGSMSAAIAAAESRLAGHGAAALRRRWRPTCARCSSRSTSCSAHVHAARRGPGRGPRPPGRGVRRDPRLGITAVADDLAERIAALHRSPGRPSRSAGRRRDGR